MVSTNRASGASPAGRSLVSLSFLLVVVGRMVTEPLETLRYSLRLPITFPSQTSPLGSNIVVSLVTELCLYNRITSKHHTEWRYDARHIYRTSIRLETCCGRELAWWCIVRHRTPRQRVIVSPPPPPPQIHNTIFAENKLLCDWLWRWSMKMCGFVDVILLLQSDFVLKYVSSLIFTT